MRNITVTLLFFSESDRVIELGEILRIEPTRVRIPRDPSKQRTPETAWNVGYWSHQVVLGEHDDINPILVSFGERA